MSHSGRTHKRLENDVFPWIGGKPVAEITASEVLAVLRRIEGRGTLDTAHRAHQTCSQVSAMPSPQNCLPPQQIKHRGSSDQHSFWGATLAVY